MLSLYERWIQFHELVIKSEPEHAPSIDMADLVPLLISRIKRNESYKLINKETAVLRIAKHKYYPNKNVIVLLLQYADQEVTDPTFLHLKRGELRTEPKLDGEGVAVSAHVALSIVSHDKIGICYRFLLEEVPGLGRSKVSPFIKSELKAAAKGSFEFNDITDNDKTKNLQPAAELLGIPTKELTEEFEGGATLQSIELIMLNAKNNEFDEAGYYTEESRRINIVPEPNGVVKDIIKKIKRSANKHGYDNVKIRYKKPEGKQKTVVMGSTKGDLADSLVVRDELIKSDEILSQCENEIVTKIARKMVRFIVDMRND